MAEVILVDGDDRPLGTQAKEAAHDGDGVLHRAFSVFLFDADGRVLLQQRAEGKRLWPLFWSNSVCSHPKPGEETRDAAERRVVEELGVRVRLEPLFKFVYRAAFGEAGSEYELCHVLAGRVHGPLSVNREEVAACRFVKASALDLELLEEPEHFTPWLKLEWARIHREHAVWLL